MKFRTQYDESMRTQKTGIVFEKPSRTKQSFSDECNINSIMNRYATCGVIDHVNTAQPLSGDFTIAPADYQEAMNIMIEAEDRFAALPSDIRKRFDNKPLNLLEFIQNPDNYEEGVKLGIFNPKVVETSEVPVRVVAPDNSDVVSS